LTSATPAEETTNTDRGRKMRLASSLESCVWLAANDVPVAKNPQYIEPSMKKAG
jgi:hypothetical protein